MARKSRNKEIALSKRSALDVFAFPGAKKGLTDLLMRVPEVNASSDERRTVEATKADGIDGVMSFGYSRYKKYHPHLPEHVHPGCFEMNFCLRGVLTFESSGREFEVKPGSVFISKPGEPHHLTSNIKGLFLYWMLFRFPEPGGSVLMLSPEETEALRTRLTSIASPNFPVRKDVHRLFQDLFQTYRMPKRDALRPVLLKSIVLRLLLSTLRDSGARPRRLFQGGIIAAAKKISEHPEQHYSIAGLAREAKLSVSRFRDLFKEATGLPPHKMIVLQRLVRAQKMLRDTDAPIAEISRKLGFSTARHFATEFKRTFGTNARAFRRHP